MKYPTTSKTLIDKLKEGDSVTWDEFYERYHQIIIVVGTAKGLNSHECNDLVQEVMIRFFKMSKTFTFDPNIAKFRTFFGRVVAGKIVDIIRKRIIADVIYDNAEEQDLDTPDEIIDKVFQEQWKIFMLEQAKEILRSRVDTKTYQAFELFAEQGRDIKKVSTVLEMSANQIYVAKNRCLKSLQKIMLELHEADPELELLKNEI